ncbi:MAG: L,D-transpeptidase [candidate division WOR-3 bacterium]
MKVSFASTIGILLLSTLIVGWSELYLPLRESLEIDVIRLAGCLVKLRSRIYNLRSAILQVTADAERLRSSVGALAEQFPAAFSSDLYVVVNTSANRLYVRRGEALIREAVVSTGSNDTLVSGSRRWIFETPRGVRTVIRKKERPVWIKPDWAFLEAGEAIPPWNSPLRRQRGVLGNYLLDLGGGVAIHGTDKEHLLGRSVTHGCIRVGGDDIKFLYDSVPLGTKVYIY